MKKIKELQSGDYLYRIPIDACSKKDIVKSKIELIDCGQITLLTFPEWEDSIKIDLDYDKYKDVSEFTLYIYGVGFTYYTEIDDDMKRVIEINKKKKINEYLSKISFLYNEQ